MAAIDVLPPRETTKDTSFFGHPRGLSTLFFTEMWERFSYYGMRALLTGYMTATLVEGGLGFDNKKAGLIYGLYTSSAYFLPVIGGWLADNVLGARRAVLIGGFIIMCGHIALAFASIKTFFIGLILVAAGTGFLKSNVSTMVGGLYGEKDARRDAGFSIFYMGINLGAFIAPLVCGALRLSVGWHYAFGAAAVGMAFGLVQYLLPFTFHLSKRILFSILIGVVATLAAVFVIGGGIAGLVGAVAAVLYYFVLGKDSLAPDGTVERPAYLIHGYPLAEVGSPPTRQAVNAGEVAQGGMSLVSKVIIAALLAGVGFLVYTKGIAWLMPLVILTALIAVILIGVDAKLTAGEWRRIGMIFILFAFSSLFWMAFEQAGSSLTLFARDLTENTIAGKPFAFETYQAVNSLFIIAFAPVFAVIWLKLGNRQPSDAVKFGIALLFASLGFVAMTYASSLTGGGKVSPAWLIFYYLMATFGELCLSPVGLSAMSKLAPAKMVALMMGVWFLSISLGNFFAGIIGGEFEAKPDVLVGLFGKVAAVTALGGVAILAISPLFRRLAVSAEAAER